MAARRLAAHAAWAQPRAASAGLRFASAAAGPADDVLFQSVGNNVKSVVLNRPKSLNALNHSMALKMLQQYKAWVSEAEKEGKGIIVLVRGSGEKAFCAGGDVVSLAGPGTRGVEQEFFWDEYQLDYYISQMAYPHVSVLRGVVMGGGVGVSLPGSHRVACETSLFAMPETAIGFAPDVGASWFLPRVMNNNRALGNFLGLTGHRLKGFDLFATGIATHFIPQEKLDDVESKIKSLGPLKDHSDAHNAVNAVLEKEGKRGGYKFSLEQHMGLIERCFNKATVEEIIEALKAESSEFAGAQLKTFDSVSPTALKVALEELKRGASLLHIAQAYEMEYNIVQRYFQTGEFHEGVRARLVEKDNKPQWQPNTLSAVQEDEVQSYFVVQPGNKKWTPLK